jgi:hypothetical protein
MSRLLAIIVACLVIDVVCLAIDVAFLASRALR